MPASEDLTAQGAPSKVLEKLKNQNPRSASPTSSNSDNTDGSDVEPGQQRPKVTRFASSVRSESDGTPALSRGLQQLSFEEDDHAPDFSAQGDDGRSSNGSSRPAGGSAPGSRSTSGNYGTSPTSNTYGMSQYLDYGSAPTKGTRSREGSASSQLGPIDTSTPAPTNGHAATARSQRPSVVRTPSNAYAPERRPSQYVSSGRTQSSRHRSSTTQQRRRNPDAAYQAQKKAYVQRLKQDNLTDEDNILVEEGYSPSLTYSSGTETDEESPATADYVSNDPYDQEAMVYLGNEDMSPSVEELKIPANRERLEWHSMLANVLTGDVVKQEKKRMTGPTEQATEVAIRYDTWLGVRAKTLGRPLTLHKRLLDEQRLKAGSIVEEIIAFEIRGEAEVGMTPGEQVLDVVKKIEKLESLYPTTPALKLAHVRAASDAYLDVVATVLSWSNTIAMINTEVGILQNWVGNDRMEFGAPREKRQNESELTDNSSFLDRILKEDGLKSVEGEHSLLVRLGEVVEKAKVNMIEYSNAYATRHLPSYIEELLSLIAFPSRLVQEIIRMRLQYAERIKDPNQAVLMAESMIPQFRILLNLAVKVKQEYLLISQPEPGWDLPPCLDENFDQVVLNAIQFYFKMLTWQMSATKNTYKEAELLEQEWGFLNSQAQSFEGGDIEVAEQFSKLTAKALDRLTSQFKKELQRRPNEEAGVDMDRRYKGILDSVRVRQRKLFRFSRQLTNTFENTTEYSINMAPHLLQELYDNLQISGHVLVNIATPDNERISVLASPGLAENQSEIVSIAGTCYRADNAPNDAQNPYVLLLYPEEQLFWSGQSIDLDIRLPKNDLKAGKLRLVAQGGNINSNGSRNHLDATNLAFLRATGFELDVLVPQRANVPSVDHQLRRIKKSAFALSSMIMGSVELIRAQLAGLNCQELIQNCFAFATEFGQRSVMYMDISRRALNNAKLVRLALEWISFICDDCIASDRKTFRWAVTALEFAMIMTRGQNILSVSDDEYALLRSKVAGCMSLLISHFDIMGARSTVAAQMKSQNMLDASTGTGKYNIDMSKLKNEEESAALIRDRWVAELNEIEEVRKARDAERRALGRVLEDNNEADRSLTFLSTASTNSDGSRASIRWQQGQYIGGGTFGSVYVATNLDDGHLMAVKEIRLQDPQSIPTIAAAIKDEMDVLRILDNVNVVAYYGIEVHRDKVYIFMEYCSGGTLANLLEYGRIEDEMVIQVYALQMLEGLAYLHSAGVIHRDIKPENILLDAAGIIKYVDFGAAKVIARQTGTLAHPQGQGGGKQKSMTGTPMYMSPEVIRGTSTFSGGKTQDTAPARPGAVDTWSLGCVVLQMATGRRPWANLDNEWAIMFNIAQGNPPQLPTRDQLSDLGIDFLQKCFEPDASRRASAAELLQHEWILSLSRQLNLEPAPQTPSTESGEMTPMMSSRESSEGY